MVKGGKELAIRAIQGTPLVIWSLFWVGASFAFSDGHEDLSGRVKGVASEQEWGCASLT